MTSITLTRTDLDALLAPAVFDGGVTAAWNAVFHALREGNPDTFHQKGTGIDNAMAEIKRLQSLAAQSLERKGSGDECVRQVSLFEFAADWPVEPPPPDTTVEDPARFVWRQAPNLKTELACPPFVASGAVVSFGTGSSIWARYDGEGHPCGMSNIRNGVIIGDGVELKLDARVMEYAVIWDGARIGADTFIGPRSVVKSGALIEDAVTVNSDALIGPGSLVESAAKIYQRATIGENACIGRLCEVSAGAVVPNNAPVGANSYIPRDHTFVADLGFTDGYRRTLVSLDGRAYISAGCRLLSIPEAYAYWERRNAETKGGRRAALATVRFADSVAVVHGLKTDTPPRARRG